MLPQGSGREILAPLGAAARRLGKAVEVIVAVTPGASAALGPPLY